MPTIDITDEATPALARITTGLRRDLMKKVGRAEENLFKTNFESLPPNKKGFPSRGFWKSASRATNHVVTEDSVMVNVSLLGIRQRIQGGRIARQDGGNLAWGIVPDTYGMRAKEYMMDHPGARVAFRRIGGRVVAIGVENVVHTATEIEKAKRGKKVWRAVASQIGRVLLFRFAKSVYQQANPNAIPSRAAILSTALGEIDAFIQRTRRSR